MTNPLHLFTLLVGRLGEAASRDHDARDRGATATEYALLVAFIAIAIAAAVTAFGSQLSGFFGGLATTLNLG